MTNAETKQQQQAAPTSVAAAHWDRGGPKEVAMNSRFLTNAGLTLAGAFTVVASMAWAPATFTWLMFAAGIAAVGLSLGAAVRGRGSAQRAIDGATAALGAWTIVASLVFSASVVTWLGFASGIGMVGLALIGLTLHELHTERVVHAFEVRTSAEEPTFAPARG
jgi:hypothetical protein